MKSPDPWALIVTDPWDNVVVPGPCYSHPFYREVPGCGDALVGGWTDTPGASMNSIGAELTALSAPGYGPYGPWLVRPDYSRLYGPRFAWPDVYLGRGGRIGAELTALSAPGYGPYGPWFYRPYGTYGAYGVFVGGDAASPPPATPPTAPPAEPPPATAPPEREGLTRELAPIVAPATGGIMVRKHLDDKHVLHVEICVDERCYSTSVDLAPALALVMQKFLAWHTAQHAEQPPPPAVASTVQAAVGAAEDLVVRSLVAQHVDTVAAGILGDIAGAVRGAVTGAARGVSRGVASTFRRLRGPIGAAAGIAAAAGASAIPGVGIVAAPLAAKLANDLVQAAAGDSAAQQAVTQAAQQAQTDPAVASALDQATQAVANSTAAYHVEETAKQAARGDVAAQRDIVQVAEDAQAGDPAAKAVADLVAQAMKSEWGAKLWEQVTGRGPGTISPGAPVVGAWGGYHQPGIIRGGYRQPGIIRGGYRYHQPGIIRGGYQVPYYGGYGAVVGSALGYQVGVEPIGHSERVSYLKVAVQAVTDAHRQRPSEAYGYLRLGNQQKVYLFPNIPDAYDWFASVTNEQDRDASARRYDFMAVFTRHNLRSPLIDAWAPKPTQDLAPPAPPPVGQYAAVGAALDDMREKARAHAVTKPGTAAGVLVTVDGRLHGRGFRNLDDAIDWLQHITRNRAAFTYAAAFEKDAAGNAFIQDEEVGGSSQPTSVPTPILRDAPATTNGW